MYTYITTSSQQSAWLTTLLPLIVHFKVGHFYESIHVETVFLALLTVYSFTRTGVMLYQVRVGCVYFLFVVYGSVCLLYWLFVYSVRGCITCVSVSIA